MTGMMFQHLRIMKSNEAWLNILYTYKDYDYIDELSHITDDLNDALDEAKENDYKIFVFEKKFAKDCLYSDKIFQDMLETFEEEGLDIGYVIGGIEEDAEKDFTKLINKWFEKYVGNNYWFTDRLLGTLRLDKED